MDRRIALLDPAHRDDIRKVLGVIRSLDEHYLQGHFDRTEIHWPIELAEMGETLDRLSSIVYGHCDAWRATP